MSDSFPLSSYLRPSFDFVQGSADNPPDYCVMGDHSRPVGRFLSVTGFGGKATVTERGLAYAGKRGGVVGMANGSVLVVETGDPEYPWAWGVVGEGLRSGGIYSAYPSEEGGGWELRLMRVMFPSIRMMRSSGGLVFDVERSSTYFLGRRVISGGRGEPQEVYQGLHSFLYGDGGIADHYVDSAGEICVSSSRVVHADKLAVALPRAAGSGADIECPKGIVFVFGDEYEYDNVIGGLEIYMENDKVSVRDYGGIVFER